MAITMHDLKPENIMMVSDTEAVLIDFGSATWRVRSDRDGALNTVHGHGDSAVDLTTVMRDLMKQWDDRTDSDSDSDSGGRGGGGHGGEGTYPNMSPERVLGESVGSHASDVYSMGLILWKILCQPRTERLPYTQCTRRATHSAIAAVYRTAVQEKATLLYPTKLRRVVECPPACKMC